MLCAYKLDSFVSEIKIIVNMKECEMHLSRVQKAVPSLLSYNHFSFEPLTSVFDSFIMILFVYIFDRLR